MLRWILDARVTLDTEFFCRCYAVQPQDFSCCRIRVTLDTVYNCQCYAFICWNGSKVVGLLQAVLLEIQPNCIHGEECSPSYRPSTCFWGDANLYPSTAFCIRLNSSKIHNSNNNVAACTAPFIPPHSLQLWDTACLSASLASHSTPSQLWVFHKLHTQSVGAPPTDIGSSQDQRIQHRDLMDLY